MKDKTWIELSRSSLINNLKQFKRIVGKKVKIFCVVKANAYGHGLKEITSILDSQNNYFFAVDSVEEGLAIRNFGISKPILVLGYTRLSNIKYAVKSNLSLTVYSKIILREIINCYTDKKIKVHLKIETGLNRQGVDTNEVIKLANLIEKNRAKIILEGLSTHYADIEDTSNSSFYVHQYKIFSETLSRLSDIGIKPLYKHTAASAATMLYRNSHFNAVRIGISLYGLWPSAETKNAVINKNSKISIDLKPVLCWKTIIAQIKKINKGESVGYGRTWYAKRNSTIAIIPIGYSDGYDRKFSNNSQVLIKGKFVPVIGRVAMNMVMLDVTEIDNVRQEDEVILIGNQGKANISADFLAQKIDTINYEIVSRINPLIPRIIV